MKKPESLVKQIEAEVAVTLRSYRDAIQSAKRLVEEAESRTAVSTHHGHNLASRAHDLAIAAERYLQTVRVLEAVKLAEVVSVDTVMDIAAGSGCVDVNDQVLFEQHLREKL